MRSGLLLTLLHISDAVGVLHIDSEQLTEEKREGLSPVCCRYGTHSWATARKTDRDNETTAGVLTDTRPCARSGRPHRAHSCSHLITLKCGANSCAGCEGGDSGVVGVCGLREREQNSDAELPASLPRSAPYLSDVGAIGPGDSLVEVFRIQESGSRLDDSMRSCGERW